MTVYVVAIAHHNGKGRNCIMRKLQRGYNTWLYNIMSPVGFHQNRDRLIVNLSREAEGLG